MNFPSICLQVLFLESLVHIKIVGKKYFVFVHKSKLVLAGKLVLHLWKTLEKVEDDFSLGTTILCVANKIRRLHQ